ncbi:class I SAM-dependent methyltransferase [Mucilaginibacter angelicae]|uniref:Class I SAM-dependent methyltransferase n=1 Tax=Mucilaginibacter angelicae TaxID=869718 RepID=A0ABV6L580_9SPHI
MEINYIHSEAVHNSDAAHEVLPYLFDLVRPESVIDIGCGTGSWLKVAKQLGVGRIRGIDGIHVDRSMLCITEEEFLQHNLTLPLPARDNYDLAICLEVAEHLPEEAADNIIEILCGHSDLVLFSAAIPGQGGQFHINEQWPAYWQKKFGTHGFLPYDILRDRFWDNLSVNWWYKQNMFLYIREGSGQRLNIKASAALPVFIHPELFDDKLQKLQVAEKTIVYLEGIILQRLTRPRFLPSLKLLLKSIIKR